MIARCCKPTRRSIIERVDVMNSASKAWDQATFLQRRQRVSGNAVLRVPNIEAPVSGARKVTEIVGDPSLDHRPHVAANRRRRDGRSRAQRAAKEAGPGGVGREHSCLITETR